MDRRGMLQLVAVTAASVIYPKLGDTEKVVPSPSAGKRNIRDEVRKRIFTHEYGETRIDFVPTNALSVSYTYVSGDRFTTLPLLVAASMQVDYWFDWQDQWDTTTGETVPDTGKIVGPIIRRITLRDLVGSPQATSDLSKGELIVDGVRHLLWLTALNPKLGLQESLLQPFDGEAYLKQYETNAAAESAAIDRVLELSPSCPLYSELLKQHLMLSRSLRHSALTAEVRFSPTIHPQARINGFSL